MKEGWSKCNACKHAAKIEGKRGLVCGHESSMGQFTIKEARKWPRWIELITFRGLCGKSGAFFKRKPREKREVTPEDQGETRLPMGEEEAK